MIQKYFIFYSPHVQKLLLQRLLIKIARHLGPVHSEHSRQKITAESIFVLRVCVYGMHELIMHPHKPGRDAVMRSRLLRNYFAISLRAR